MKTLTMKFRVIFDYDPVTQSYSAVCPELPGCASPGETEAEARQNIVDAIRLYLAPTDIDLPENAKVVEVRLGERGASHFLMTRRRQKVSTASSGRGSAKPVR